MYTYRFCHADKPGPAMLYMSMYMYNDHAETSDKIKESRRKETSQLITASYKDTNQAQTKKTTIPISSCVHVAMYIIQYTVLVHVLVCQCVYINFLLPKYLKKMQGIRYIGWA